MSIAEWLPPVPGSVIGSCRTPRLFVQGRLNTVQGLLAKLGDASGDKYSRGTRNDLSYLEDIMGRDCARDVKVDRVRGGSRSHFAIAISQLSNCESRSCGDSIYRQIKIVGNGRSHLCPPSLERGSTRPTVNLHSSSLDQSKAIKREQVVRSRESGDQRWSHLVRCNYRHIIRPARN